MTGPTHWLHGSRRAGASGAFAGACGRRSVAGGGPVPGHRCRRSGPVRFQRQRGDCRIRRAGRCARLGQCRPVRGSGCMRAPRSARSAGCCHEPGRADSCSIAGCAGTYRTRCGGQRAPCRPCRRARRARAFQCTRGQCRLRWQATIGPAPRGLCRGGRDDADRYPRLVDQGVCASEAGAPGSEQVVPCSIACRCRALGRGGMSRLGL